MSIATALTIIAISMAVLAVVSILAVIFLTRLVLHLIAFEQTLAGELRELRQLAAQLRETTERVGQTVHDVQAAARRVGGAVGTVASLAVLFMGRSTKIGAMRRWRPWLTGASIGWRLIRRRRGPKPSKQEKKPLKKTKTKPAITSQSNSSLPL